MHWLVVNLMSKVGSTPCDFVSLAAGTAAGADNAVDDGREDDAAAADGKGLAVLLLLLPACSSILKAFSVISTA